MRALSTSPVAPLLSASFCACFCASLVLASAVASGTARAEEAPASDAADVTTDYLRKVTTSVKPVPFAVPFDLVIVLDRAEGERIEIPASLPENKEVRPAGRPRRERATSGPGRVNERILIPMIALDTEGTQTPALVLRAPGGGRIEIPPIDIDVVDPEAKDEDVPPPSGQRPAGGGKAKGSLAPTSGAAVDGAGAVRKAQAPTAAVEPAKRSFFYNIADSRPWAVISTLVASILALLASLWIERRRNFAVPMTKATESTEPEVRVPPHQRALQRLDALLKGPLLKEGNVEAFVEQLMNAVLREYLEERFDLMAESQTTRELAEDLLKVGHPSLDVTTVRTLLENADLVKFARADLGREVAHQMAKDVRGLIVATAERVSGGENA